VLIAERVQRSPYGRVVQREGFRLFRRDDAGWPFRPTGISIVDHCRGGSVKIHVRLFASVREIVGHKELVWEVPVESTVSTLSSRLVSEYPKLRALAPSLKFAVNHEYADTGRVLAEGDEVALIPPVSGGVDIYDVTDAPLSLDALVAAVGQNSSGAIASFLGVVRGHARGRQVDHLEYDAYSEMAVAKMRQIGDEIRSRWPVDRVAILHRVGSLGVGEASVAIVIGSPHRHEALQACAYAIERLKEIVPIWKKEIWSDGAEWIGSTVDEYRMHGQRPTTEGRENPHPPQSPEPNVSASN
jgi:molybdopterin converting factor subunit 1